MAIIEPYIEGKHQHVRRIKFLKDLDVFHSRLNVQNTNGRDFYPLEIPY